MLPSSEVLEHAVIVMQEHLVVDVGGMELRREVLGLLWVVELLVVWRVREELISAIVPAHHPWVLMAVLALLEGTHLPMLGVLLLVIRD